MDNINIGIIDESMEGDHITEQDQEEYDRMMLEEIDEYERRQLEEHWITMNKEIEEYKRNQAILYDNEEIDKDNILLKDYPKGSFKFNNEELE